MTRGDLIRHTSMELGLDNTTGADEYNLMKDWAQDAVYDFLIRTRVRLTSGTLTLTAGQGDYSLFTLDPTIMDIENIFYTASGITYTLERVTLAEILSMRQATTANDRARYYAAEGDQLSVWPTPASADTIGYWGVKRPTALSSDSDDFTTTSLGGIPVQYHPVLLSYMLMRGSRYEGTRQAPHTPEQYSQFYERDLAKARNKVRGMVGRSYPAMAVGYPARRGSPGVRNDIY